MWVVPRFERATKWGLAKWQAADDESRADFRADDGRVHMSSKPETAPTLRPTDQGPRRHVDATP